MKTTHQIKYGGKLIAFPAQVKISFAPVLDTYRKMCRDEDKTMAQFACALLEEMDKYPVLEEGFTDESLLKKLEPQISKLLRPLFPDALSTNEIKGVTAPFQFTPFFYSTRFKNILKSAGKDFEFKVMDYTEDEIYIFVCCIILGSVYHYDVAFGAPFKLSIPDIVQQKTKTYRIAFNAELMKAVATEKAPPITPEDFALLIERFDDISLWKEKFPPGSYLLSGIGIMNLMDVTVDQSIAAITTSLVTKPVSFLTEITNHIRVIFNKPNLRIGYIDYDQDTFYWGQEKTENHSIMLSNTDHYPCKGILCSETYNLLIENRKPLVIADAEKYNKLTKNRLSEKLIQEGIESYILIPLIYEDVLLGLLELASTRKYELSLASLTKLSEILPILSIAVSHQKSGKKNEFEAVIQREFTQIHESVKWRFDEEAAKYIRSIQSNEKPETKDLDFPNVYPLFGQLDIKGSSVTRNDVIKKDITNQLKAVQGILLRALHKKQFPFFEELNFRISKYIESISGGLQAGSEHEILRFLKKEIYPVFEHLKKTDKAMTGRIKKYESLLDSQLNIIYNERRKFDETVSMINTMLTTHLDKRQAEAQQMFPHYFERYKTDGIEYNIYVGESIAKGLVFDKIYVQNLRLWQLIIMCELENEFYFIKPNLQHPLEIASLIMVHGDPLDIHFRLDEKRFDVKGAYNARYEIIKSRIDKAHVRGTEERITSPGKLVIVYSNEQDVAEYLKYLQFLTTKGYFKKDTLEKLMLEDLQGITGLLALRIEYQYAERIKGNDRPSISRMMETMESNQGTL